MLTDDENEELCRLHETLPPLFRARAFGDAAALLREQRDSQQNAEMASNISRLLANVLTMAGNDDAALEEARRAESLAPDDLQSKLCTARILLDYQRRPVEALEKTSEVINQLDRTHYLRYETLSLHGSALARVGNLEGAVEVFRELSDPATLVEHAKANYAGVFDLRVVSDLVFARVALPECRRYLEFVRAQESVWPHLEKQLEQLLAASN
jgi:hypothetical protein